MELPGSDALFRELRAITADGDGHGRRVELARAAYSSDDCRVPRKAAFLLEWLLERLLKTRDLTSIDREKAEDSSLPPLLDTRYWTLLHDILANGNVTRELKQTVIRIPVLPTLASFLARLPELASPDHKQLLHAVDGCYAILLPLTVSSSNTDALVACTSSYIASSSKVKESQEWTSIGSLLTESLTKLPADRSTQKKVDPLFAPERARLTANYSCQRLSWRKACRMSSRSTNRPCHRQCGPLLWK